MGPLPRVRSLAWRLLVLAVVLWWFFSDGPVLAFAQWVLVGYVCWRAVPGVGSDLGRLRGLVVGRRLDGARGQGLL